MTARFFRFLVCQLLLVFACASVHAAEGIEITRASISASDDGYRLGANYSFELTSDLEQAVMHGVPLHFTTEIELTRPRWWWYDDKAVSRRRTVRLHYDLLTRQYTVQVIGSGQQAGSLQQSYSTLEEALFLIRRPVPWLIASRGGLKSGETYNVTLRMFMDRDYLQKPLQVDAFNNSDLRLASHKKTFTYRAE